MKEQSHSASTCCDKTTGLQSLDNVIHHLITAAKPTTDTTSVALKDALNKTLAENLESSLNVPPSDNSAVDGYALRVEDLKNMTTLPVSQRVPAGIVPSPLKPGTAARIFTGASIPEGADCVVMQEDCHFDDTNQALTVNSEAREGQNIRPLGQDIAAGNTVINKGMQLSAQSLGLTASIGAATVKIFTPLKVAILSTGDELVEPGEQANPGQIFNSNRYMLHGLLSSLGMEVIDLGVIEDTLDSTIEAINKASQLADVIISTGGASVGEEDHVQSAIKSLGSIDLWRVAIKPGKPFMFGEANNTPILGLPGNPGAVLVTFLLLARPFLLCKQGRASFTVEPFYLPLGFDVKKSGKRREFLRVQRSSGGAVIKHPNQSSGMLSSATWAEGLAIIEENTAPKTGDLVPFLPFAQLLT